jgi:phospholipid-transporting ATPase
MFDILYYRKASKSCVQTISARRFPEDLVLKVFALNMEEDEAIPQHRIIHINDIIKNEQQRFLHNRITTGKYQIYNFVLKFLKEQFSKYANVFFLFIAIVQVILID